MSQSPLVDLNYYALLVMFFITWISGGYWLYVDSKTRGSSYSVFWALSWILFWPIGVCYLIRIRQEHNRQHPPSRRENISAVIAGSSILATAIGVSLSSSVSISQAGTVIICFGILIPTMYYILLYRENGSISQGTEKSD